MIEELVKQARRLFSSKSNGGKQVAQLTDRLHTYKQVLVALSCVLLIGYSQFREHFKCQGNGDWDSKATTNFCLMNGTTTVVHDNGSVTDPHTGLGFQTTGSDKVISHNYMRNYWYLLILLAVHSYVAQRIWASIFENEVLKALLQLPGSAELRQVRAAEQAKPYETLSSLSSDLTRELKRQMVECPKEGEMSRNELVARRIALVEEYVNIYDHTLDYYPNQLTYLLLTKKTSAFKVSSLRMRRRLMEHSLISTFIALFQFGLAVVVFGNEFILYGWHYLCATIKYIHLQIVSDSTPFESIDHELSSSLFPINTQCRIKQYSMTGTVETMVFQCTIAINELGSKLFVFIWWLLIISAIIELASLIALAFSSINFKTVSWTFGQRFWPAAREQADLIATFRYKRSVLMRRSQLIKQLRKSGPPKDQIQLVSNTKPLLGNSNVEPAESKKRLECDLSYGLDGSIRSDRPSSKQWYMWCPRDLCMALRRVGSRWVCCQTNKRLDRLDRESHKDINIYFLLYLIYLRLGKSRTKVEEVIKMTACALGNYLSELETQCEELQVTQLNDDHAEETDDYNSLDRDDQVVKMC